MTEPQPEVEDRDRHPPLATPPGDPHGAKRPAPDARVRRGTTGALVGAVIIVAVLVVMTALPYVVPRGTQQTLVTLFSLVTLGTMWNLLAGYGGMVSIGQQAYIGIGAYGLVHLADVVGLDPFLAVPAAVVICGGVAFLLSFLVFRLAGGYFAIGTWVVAEVIRLLIIQVDVIGGGSGISLAAFNDLTPGFRIAYVYWLSLVGMVVAVLVTYLLMRSRLGLGFTAIRDDATAAGSLGVDVTRSRRVVYLVSSMGCGLAGAMIAANTLRVQPESVFSVNYTAFMIFIVVIGGIGTIEGPILGALVFFALQEWLADLGVWYLIVLGVVAITVTLLAPRGLWGLLTRGRLQLFPVGYTLANSGGR